MTITQDEISAKLSKLNDLSIFLKDRYEGIDTEINKIISYMTPWYIFPDALMSPHIICLWGMTGCGKTTLVRDIVEFLEMSSQFTTTIHPWGMNKCNITSKNQMILLLDEFQHFRTKDEQGCRNNNTTQTDIWEFLSSGAISSMGFWEQLIEFDEEDHLISNIPKELDNLIRGKSKEEKLELLKFYCNKTRIVLPRTLIFICGNVDSAYPGSSDLDDESDADKYYELSKKITLQDIRKELDKMFFPEHISRLGSNHVIFPAFSTDAYEKIVKHTCNELVSSYEKLVSRKIVINDSVLNYLYNISVVPTQGARPVISTIRSFLGYYIPRAICTNTGDLNISIIDKNIIINNETIPLVDISKRKTVMDIPEQDLIDCIIHESGHIVVSIALGILPYSVSILGKQDAVSSFIEDNINGTPQHIRDRICIALAGKQAQSMVFGSYCGCDSDVTFATNIACRMVREHYHHGIFGRYETNVTTSSMIENGQHDIEIQKLIEDMELRSKQLLQDNMNCFKDCVKILRNHRKISSIEMKKLIEKYTPNVSEHKYQMFKSMFDELE